MFDAALIKECADPSLKPAIVERFVAAAGSTNPFEVTVEAGGRLILVPKAKSAEEAMAVVQQYVGQAVVRVGLTQFPAGIGVKDVADLKSDLVDQCNNLRTGTAMFAKVLRIVAKWYGNPKSNDVFPQIFEDAVFAWRTGEFEGVNVFRADDPGTPVAAPKQIDGKGSTEEGTEATPTGESSETEQDVGRAGIRINLSRIGAEPQH